MFPTLQIGPLAIQSSGLIILFGLWIGLELAERHAARYGMQTNQIFTATLIMLGSAIIGGRLFFAASNPQVFFENPLSLFSLSPLLINFAGGLAFALMAVMVYASHSRLHLWPLLDCLTTLLAVLMVSINLANFASGDAFGITANIPWAVYLWGSSRHPIQIYEMIAALLITVITWPWSASKFADFFKQDGMRFWVFIALSAVSRLFLEVFRADSILILDLFRQAQVLAWLVLALSLWQILGRLSPSAVAAKENP
jgi:phosphatidylglycerol---prolipoprotein diacylglyceryl transferase